MLGVALEPKKVNNFLKKYREFIDKEYKLGKYDNEIIVPIKKEFFSFFKDNYKIVEFNFEKKEKLKINKSFDIIGEVIIFNFTPPTSEEIEILKKMYPFLKAILVKTDKINNIYRVPEYKLVFGMNTETVHKENGIILKLDPTKVYFSPRLSGERKRILDQIKENEKIFVPFAGIGPYPILFKKFKPYCEIHSVEINPEAYKFFLENVKLNKIKEDKFFVYLDDAKKIIKKFENCYFDRILSPLPRYSHKYISLFWDKLKKGGTYHYYRLAESENQIKEELEKILGKDSFDIKGIKITGSSTPKEKRYCFDLVKIK